LYEELYERLYNKILSSQALFKLADADGNGRLSRADAGSSR
jgi:hypothetical protein